jgi:hypothetical protein
MKADGSFLVALLQAVARIPLPPPPRRVGLPRWTTSTILRYCSSAFRRSVYF